MRKSPFFIIAVVLLQNCYSYKTIDVSQVKAGRSYQMKMENGPKVESKCSQITNDTITFNIKKQLAKFPINEIDYIKRKRISPLKVVIIAGAITTAAILEYNSNQKTSSFEKTRPH